jgi:ABC-type nitrate/sulfonate/bicarbonate transport system permease component
MSQGSARESGRWASRAVQLLFLMALLALWYGLTTWGQVSPILLPNPLDVLHELRLVLSTGEFVGDLLTTLSELAFAFSIAMILGTVTGYLISRSGYLIAVLEPLLAGIYSIPIILFLPLYSLLFGLGPASKIALGATISFFPIALNTIAGFGNVDTIYVTSARSMGASNFQLFRFVLVPAALPVILTGLRMGFTLALLAILGSEVLASLSGIGHKIAELDEKMDRAHMFAYIAFAVVIAAVLNTIVSGLEARGKR